MTIWQVRALLADRGLVLEDESDFRFRDNIDGKGQFIDRWDKDKLGPKPSKEDLEALQTEADALKDEAVAGRPDNKLKASLNALPPTPMRDALLAWLADRGV
ncbi:hypothetical protein LCGC14_1733020 [marine sediment metagenome]|uniref:Bacteriophage SP-beta YorD domain-containing protein n=1 Tax=marine sediment metagenome TaxID=412755 RepID=A0A0F9JPD6_9ZZZZ